MPLTGENGFPHEQETRARRMSPGPGAVSESGGAGHKREKPPF